MMDWLRPEDDRLTRGAGRYPSNIERTDSQPMWHAAFVRSAEAHARIRGLDFSAIAKFNAHIFTGDDLAGLVHPAINPLLALEPLALQATPLLPLPKGGLVTAIGAPLAVVLAASPEQARLAAEQVVITYESLPIIADGDAIAPLIAQQAWGKAVDASDFTSVSITHAQPRVAPFTLEPRALQATWNAASQHLTVRMGSQTPSRTQGDIAKALDLASEQVRVISIDVGGAYGAKSTIYPEELITAWAAKKLAASVHWRAMRSEEFESGNHGRGGHLQGTLWVGKDGRLAHLQTDTRFVAGNWLPFSVVAPALNSARLLPGPYALASVDLHARVQQSHTNATNIYRGAGRPEACLLMERLMDEAATKLEMDPLEIRLLNFIRADQMPFKTAAGQTLDSGDFAALLNRCAEIFGYERRRQAQTLQSTRIKGIANGIGIACFTEPCGTGFESATVRLHADGSVDVMSGSADQGQGHSASYAQIAAEALGCSPSAVRVTEGDTAACPAGVGALASRSIAIGGSAVLQAAQAVLELQKNPYAVYPLEASVNYTPAFEAWSAGCTMAEVSIDVETGEIEILKICMVDDAGRIISPKLAHGQLLGGAAQGLGQAMMERLVYSSAGQLLTGSLMDYAIPRASDMPPISISHLLSHTSANILNAKGVGEAGTIGVPAAILNAVCDALKQHDAGIDTTQLSFPLTSEKIWNVLQSV